MSLTQRLEPQTRAYVEWLLNSGRKPLQELSIEDARQYMRDSQPTPLGAKGISVETVNAAGIALTIVKPADAVEALPAVLYLHGGGWLLGGVATHARILHELATRSRVAMVVPEYSLAPEAPFPQALNECYATAQWIQSGAARGVDGSRLAVAGDSAGGNLAAAVALRAANRGDLKLKLQALICPALEADLDTESYLEFSSGMNLTRDAMAWFWEQYVPGAAMRRDPEASPLLASEAALAKVTPALILTAECDVLRDDGEKYFRRLAQAGASVTGMRFMGTIHNFPVIDDLRNSDLSIAALQMLVERFRASLHTAAV